MQDVTTGYEPDISLYGRQVVEQFGSLARLLMTINRKESCFLPGHMSLKNC